MLKRILPEIKPEILASVINVKRLPPTDFSIISAANNDFSQSTEFDEHSPGILDVFLSCIAKALSVQVKVKGRENGKALQTVSLATSIHPKSQVGARWWLRGCMTRKLAEVIIQLLKDMASVCINQFTGEIFSSIFIIYVFAGKIVRSLGVSDESSNSGKYSKSYQIGRKEP